LTLPVNILSLGLFTFVINAIVLMMVSGVISGFEVNGGRVWITFDQSGQLASYIFYR
jgi:uncharacterized membrane protein YvlD (DUF360 family)